MQNSINFSSIFLYSKTISAVTFTSHLNPHMEVNILEVKADHRGLKCGLSLLETIDLRAAQC